MKAVMIDTKPIQLPDEMSLEDALGGMLNGYAWIAQADESTMRRMGALLYARLSKELNPSNVQEYVCMLIRAAANIEVMSKEIERLNQVQARKK